jgi:hypothetical protein
VPSGVEVGGVAGESFTFSESTQILTVEWWGTYKDVCDEPCQAIDDFTVDFYVNETGPASTFVARYDFGGAVARTPTGYTIPLGAGLTEYAYSAELWPPLTTKAGKRYWVEIRNNAVDWPCAWLWETAPEGATGNGTSLYDEFADGYDETDLAPYDLAFCVSGLPESEDCNANGVNDAQDISEGTSLDCEPNGIPDECEDDRNFNGIPDDCDIVSGTSEDLDFNGVPDEADCLTTPGDLDGDCDVERDDFAAFAACMGSSGPDLLNGCVCADFDRDWTVDMTDYLAFSASAGQPVEGCRARSPDACPDSWTTGGPGRAEIFYDFGAYGPIPAGFFGEGSDPFGEIVTFVGTPADPNGVYGDVDTQIDHGPVIFDPATGIAQATLDIITLNLISREPIIVTYDGGQNPEEWLAVAGLSPHYPPSGELTATLDDPEANSGTYDATVYVQPAFLFVRRQDLIDHLLPECLAARVLDTGDFEAGRSTMPPIELSFSGEPFVRVADPNIVEQISVAQCAQGNFVPGVVETGARGRSHQDLTCTSHITQGEAHYFCPPECQGPDRCRYYSKNAGPSPAPPCANPPEFPDQMLGLPCPDGTCPQYFTPPPRPCVGGGVAFQTYTNAQCVTMESTCDGACCDNQGNCVLSADGLCDGTYMGDETRCDTVTCPQGACCHGDGSCDLQAPTACNGPDDTYQGDATQCVDYTPTITQQPEDSYSCVGGDAEFTITATTSGGTLHYQWKQDGSDVGSDSATLTLTNVQASDDGAQITCEVKNDCDTVTSDPATLTVVAVDIQRPKGSLVADPNPTASWLTTPCRHFDFQAVASISPGPYVLDIEGQIDPVPPFGYNWTLDAAVGTLANETTATPNHTAPATAGQGTLTLNAMLGAEATGCEDERELKVYTDHLARDFENFGTAISCLDNWSFTRFNVTISMGSTWNCHGSVRHAYNGSGNGYSGTTVGWTTTEYTPPVDWATVQSSLSRGDVVSFYSGTSGSYVLQHSHTCRGAGTQMYGANNEPSVDFNNSPPATWQWYECSSQQYFDAVNIASQAQLGYDFLTRILVHDKP